MFFPPFLCFFFQSKEIAFQLQEDLMKVLNELYTVSSDGRPSKQRARGLKSRTLQLKCVTKDQILNIGANRRRFQRFSSPGKPLIHFTTRVSFCTQPLLPPFASSTANGFLLFRRLSPHRRSPIRCAVSLSPRNDYRRFCSAVGGGDRCVARGHGVITQHQKFRRQT